MSVAGRKPKAESERRNRVRPTYDWIEVQDTAFLGAPPVPNGRWPKATLEWWADVSTMPHCTLWTKSDWRFCIDTMRVVAAFHRGDAARAAEVRLREALLGVTADARRDLRIRYVEGKADEERSELTTIDEYRQRLGA